MSQQILFLLFLIALASCRSGERLLPNNVEVKTLGSVVAANDVKLLTYNVKAVSTKPDGETDALISYLNREKFDIVTLQEVFSERTRVHLVDSLSKSYPTVVSRVDYGGWHSLFEDAGLMILSKYPAVDLSSLQFDTDIKNKGTYLHKRLDKEMSVTLDAFANKSIAVTLLQHPHGKHILVGTTHAQAFGTNEHKRKQLNEMRDFLTRVVNAVLDSGLSTANELSVILTGDLNIDANYKIDHDKLIQLLGQPTDLFQIANGEKLEYTFSAGMLNVLFRFDYIFSWPILDGISLNTPTTKVITVTDIKTNGLSISDHYPVIGLLSF